ncbi:metallophosphoesterase family protein [Falsiporphyromonas endometrii]|uniref:Metallophosphoesterase family protein n=1 Tax=Falsiporphyromonas endometrii TaxID=1387297 RepID=A0ABV9K6C0_9PORP
MKLNKVRTKNLVGTLIVVSLLGIILGLRWKTWFSNLPELLYTTPDSITRLTVVPGQRMCRDVTITWRAGVKLVDGWADVTRLTKDSLNRIVYLTDKKRYKAKKQLVPSRGGIDVYYHVALKDLQPGGNYKVVVHTKSASNSDSTIVHMPNEDKPLNFLYLGDIQDISDRIAKERMNYIKPILKEMDFTLQIGDLIERPMNTYWNLVYNSCGELFKKQFIATPGNHEVIKGLIKRIDPRWRAQFNFPINGPISQLGLSYYVDHPYCRFISINSNNVDLPWQLYDQLKWLEQTLKSATQPFIIVFMHHAVKPVRSTRTHPIMFHMIRPLLEKYHVDLVLQGHDHSYARTTHPDEDKKVDFTPPVYVISTFSSKCYENGFSRAFDRMGSGIAFYSKIKITKTKIQYEAFTFDGKPTDRFALVREDRDPKLSRTNAKDALFIDQTGNLPEYLLFNQFGNSKKARERREAYKEAVKKRYSQRN